MIRDRWLIQPSRSLSDYALFPHLFVKHEKNYPRNIRYMPPGIFSCLSRSEKKLLDDRLLEPSISRKIPPICWLIHYLRRGLTAFLLKQYFVYFVSKFYFQRIVPNISEVFFPEVLASYSLISSRYASCISS
jgi:hypothetical protein